MSNSHFKLWLEGLFEMAKHYGTVFRESWRNRVELEGAARTRTERDFLPAALSLQETPTSPLPRIVLWLVVGLFFVVIAWSILASIDVVVSATGRFIPSELSKVVQPLETSVVKAIHVREGQHVKQGDLLVELDGTVAGAEVKRSQSTLVEANLQAARAQAFLDSIKNGHDETLPRVEGASAEQIARAKMTLSSLLLEHHSKIERTDAAIARQIGEMRSTEQLVRKLESTLPITEQQLAAFKELLVKNYVSKSQYSEKEKDFLETQADLAYQRSRVEQLKAAVREVESQKMAFVAETRRAMQDSLQEATLRSQVLSQDVVKADRRDQQLKLTAPVDGTVQQMAVTTLGGVVTPAEKLMVIVPENQPLEIEVIVQNRDIGFVHPGQVVDIKIDTFPFTRYGTVSGRVLNVSQDAVNDPKLGLIYSARVLPSKSTLKVDGRDVPLTPGMSVRADIAIGSRRIIEFFLSPFVQHVSEGLRER